MTALIQTAQEFLYETSNVRLDATEDPIVIKLNRELLLAADNVSWEMFANKGPEKYYIEREPTIPDAAHWLRITRHHLRTLGNTRTASKDPSKLTHLWCEASNIIGKLLAYHALRSGWVFVGELMFTGEELAIPLNCIATEGVIFGDSLSEIYCLPVHYQNIKVYRFDRPRTPKTSSLLPSFPTSHDLSNGMKSADAPLDSDQVLRSPGSKSRFLRVVPEIFKTMPAAQFYRPYLDKSLSNSGRRSTIDKTKELFLAGWEDGTFQTESLTSSIQGIRIGYLDRIKVAMPSEQTIRRHLKSLGYHNSETRMWNEKIIEKDLRAFKRA